MFWKYVQEIILEKAKKLFKSQKTAFRRKRKSVANSRIKKLNNPKKSWKTAARRKRRTKRDSRKAK